MRINVLDGVGGVDHLAYGELKSEKRNHAVPGIALCGADLWESQAPRGVGKGFECSLRPFGIDGCIDKAGIATVSALRPIQPA